jgi:hypothetical protein
LLVQADHSDQGIFGLFGFGQSEFKIATSWLSLAVLRCGAGAIHLHRCGFAAEEHCAVNPSGALHGKGLGA